MSSKLKSVKIYHCLLGQRRNRYMQNGMIEGRNEWRTERTSNWLIMTQSELEENHADTIYQIHQNASANQHCMLLPVHHPKHVFNWLHSRKQQLYLLVLRQHLCTSSTHCSLKCSYSLLLISISNITGMGNLSISDDEERTLEAKLESGARR